MTKAPGGWAWCIEFWDSDHWDSISFGEYPYREQAQQACEAMNRTTAHSIRQTIYGGHRFRVRRRRVSSEGGL